MGTQEAPRSPRKEAPGLAVARPCHAANILKRNGLYCFPLTVVDGYLLYLLGRRAFLNTKGENTRKAPMIIFREYDLPSIIRSDNGTPFA